MRILFCLLLSLNCFSQRYTCANAHSHNDYEQAVPFYTAYNAGFGSIEADIFLVDGQLYVAHNKSDIRTERTLAALYLEPLQNSKPRPLQLLIDIKTDAEPTLGALIKLLEQYKRDSLKIVITGNRPDNSKWTNYPSWIFFDGRPNEKYSDEVSQKVALISDRFSSWDDVRPLVEAAHKLNKPIRFWGTPDNAEAWKQLINYKVDYINTDKIKELANFLTN